MNPKTLVKLSNIIGIISIILLMYWIFAFIAIEVCGFKVFQRHITETFYMSIFAILALMFGALIVNIMFNLTRIAEKQNADEKHKPRNLKRLGWFFGLSFPLLFLLLAGGNLLSANKRKDMLINSAESIIISNEQKTDSILNYAFDRQWVIRTSETLNLWAKTDKYFPHISVIVKEKIDNTDVYLSFERYTGLASDNDTIQPSKMDYVRETTKKERDYMQKVFDGKTEKEYFVADGGNYELFYPYVVNGKTVIFYFSDYQKYGKISGY